jgi:hypothetical protein
MDTDKANSACGEIVENCGDTPMNMWITCGEVVDELCITL